MFEPKDDCNGCKMLDMLAGVSMAIKDRDWHRATRQLGEIEERRDFCHDCRTLIELEKRGAK